ncbi:TlpA family protein disulfide reductase [Kribbella sp. NPDC051620]|uniref:TlpA family protein disulfide reductase n=1 Tax=Kribbella sp. NPDC051620 TaxID=3364120 RepID=UPI00378C30E7
MSKLSSPRTTLRHAALIGVLAAAGLLLAGCGDQKADGQPQTGPTSATVAGADQLTPCPTVESRPPVANALPDVSLPCLGDGPDIRLSDLRGPLLVNVWAQWCGPCRHEAPYLAALHAKAGDKVKLIGIDYIDTRPDLAVKFAVEQKWDYPHVADRDKQIQQGLKIGGPPLTAFVDAKGAVVYVHRAPFTSQQELDQLVREKLGVTW